MNRYEELAQLIRRQIHERQLRPGDRLPSLRCLCEQAKVSKNTAIRAYVALEDEGLIEPRERSGFFVRNARAVVVPAHEPPVPREVRLGATALSVIRAAGEPQGIALGSAHPAVQFPACREFYRILGRESYRRVNDAKMGGHYPDPSGYLPLRRVLVQRMYLQGCTLDADELVVTNGAMEAVSLALRTVAAAGDIIAVEKPAYYGTLNCIEALGMKALEIPSHQELGMDLELLAELLRQWPVKAIVVNPTFNNPMGFTMPFERRQQLLKIASAYDLPIIEDDIFGELYFAKTGEPRLKQLDRDGRVIYCNSLSKTLHSDIRLGWAAPGRYYERMAYLKYVSSMASPGIIQSAAARFLTGHQYERHLRNVRRHYQEARDGIMMAIYRYWPGQVSVSRPEGGFLLWCVFPPGTDGDALYQRAKSMGINIAPGSLFSCDNAFRHCIRLNFATWSNSPLLLDAMRTLGGLIAAQRER